MPTYSFPAPKLESRFGLIKHPFSKDVPVEELFEHKDAEGAITRLLRALSWHCSSTLTGESGCGKTFVFRSVEAKLPAGRYKVCYVHNSTLKVRDFYRQLSMHLGLEPKATSAALFRGIHNYVEETSAQKVHPIIVIDEAHLLPLEVLQNLHILLNFQRGMRPRCGNSCSRSSPSITA